MNLVLDSTGLNIYGEGEWKVRKHGYSKRRTWCKLHVGANPDTGGIQVAVLTGNSTSDDAVVKEMLAQIEQTLLACAADGAYDKRKVYDALNEHSPDVEILIPPRKNAHIWQHGNSKEERLKRDENLRYIRKYGRQQWKQDSGYHIRSLAETIMFRLKTILVTSFQLVCWNADQPGSHPLFGTQQNDPSGHSAKLSGCLIPAASWSQCAFFSIYAPKPHKNIYFQIFPYPYSPSSSFPSAKRLNRNGVISTVLGLPSRINSTKLAPAAGDVLKPVPDKPQAR